MMAMYRRERNEHEQHINKKCANLSFKMYALSRLEWKAKEFRNKFCDKYNKNYTWIDRSDV